MAEYGVDSSPLKTVYRSARMVIRASMMARASTLKPPFNISLPDVGFTVLNVSTHETRVCIATFIHDSTDVAAAFPSYPA